VSALREQRLKFSEMISEFVLWVPKSLPGYQVVYGEILRGPAQIAWNVAHGVGIGKTLHQYGLAADLSLYINGVYQTDTEAYRPLGEEWERRGGTWGGRFKDGNHFSLEWKGIR